MKVAIIGAGFTGLSAGYYLAKDKHDVTIFEKSTKAGGLALGFRKKQWRWSLEQHYHHIFTSDGYIKELARLVGIKIKYVRPKTSTFYQGKIYQLDSPFSLLTFNQLSLLDRIRTGLVIFYLKYLANWKKLEGVSAEIFLKKSIGEKAWQVLFMPLFISKFGKYYPTIPASWFWARIKKRSTRLGYPIGGFQRLANKISKEIKKNRGNILFKTSVENIVIQGKQIKVRLSNGEKMSFDKLICTLPTKSLAGIASGLNEDYLKKLNNQTGLGVVTIILSIKEKFFNDKTYWLNVNDIDFPFTAVVEHTNFVKKVNYNDENLVYVSKYVPVDHEYINYSTDKLISKWLPYLKKINTSFKKTDIDEIYLFKSTFAQPVVGLNHSQIIPSIKTPIKRLYLANMQQVYPWDRGTNYAVELGKKVAKIIS